MLSRLLPGRAAPAAAEIEAWQRENTFLPAEEGTPDMYPSLYNLSVGMMFGGVIRPIEPELPDYVAIAMNHPNLEMAGQIGMWNILWEAVQPPSARRFPGSASVRRGRGPYGRTSTPARGLLPSRRTTHSACLRTTSPSFRIRRRAMVGPMFSACGPWIGPACGWGARRRWLYSVPLSTH